MTEILTFEKNSVKILFHFLKQIFELPNLPTLTNYISIDRVFSWLFINMNNSIFHDVWIYLESIAGSTSFHTQTGTLYP